MSTNVGKKRKTRENDHEEEEMEVERPITNISSDLRSKFYDINSKYSTDSHALTLKYNRDFTGMAINVESRIASLSKRLKKFSDLESKMESNILKLQSLINLNIGGRLFTASKETLMSITQTYFYGMLSFPDRYPTLPDGSYFIDRNPDAFQRILDFLRTGKLIIKDLSERELDLLKSDLDYYSIIPPEGLFPPPPVVISWDENRKSTNATLSNNNLTVTKTSEVNGFDCGVIGSQAVDKYTVYIDSIGNHRILIGFSTGVSWEPNGENHKTNGWFFNINSGRLYGIGINPNAGVAYTTEEFATGDYVTVIREGTTIRFQKNKVDLGVCTPFTNIPDQPLLPALDINYINISLTLVHDY